MKIVFALGGSILVPDEPDLEFMRKFAGFVKELSKKHRIAIVVGGGRAARRRISEARKKGANEVECDYIGIEASRENARMFAEILGEMANREIPGDFLEAKAIWDKGKGIVMGGTEPGHSTDAVAVILAEYLNADLVLKTTDVDGIYDKDPQKSKNAKMFKTLPLDKLQDMVAHLSQDAGKYELIDMVGVKILQRSGIKCIALNGRNLENIKKAIEGKGFVGTVIK
ncbi:MAG: UMP kinase [Candidatus Altiarchaeota archaeon]|nr:UMP kinase [Candidatus Altiarchaeota archaeon]